jgi:hypothetical protein
MAAKINPLDPVRHPDETLPEYRARRKSANEAAKREIRHSSHAASNIGGSSKAKMRGLKDSGQHPKPLKERKRRKVGAPFAGARKRLVIPRGV